MAALGVVAGAMDRQITLRVNTPAQDDFGEPVESWADLATVWAQVEPLRGRELYEAQRIQAEVDTRFRIRYRDDVSVLNEIVYDGATYDIQAVIEIGRRAGLEILAKARLP